jgi:tetratricopeptide (TPR) repeat protein
MATKATILLLILLVLNVDAFATATLEGELRDAIQKNDWQAQVLLLNPRKGQNFEHDLQLARALIQLEKRAESLGVLQAIPSALRDERVERLVRAAGEMFFSQETSNLFFEGLGLLELSKFGEARERFEQALSREPGNLLVLTRLAQTEILTGAFDQAQLHVKEALAQAPTSPELRSFALKIALSKEDSVKGDPSRILVHIRRPYPKDEVPFVFALEALKRVGKADEIRSIAKTLIKEHPRWVHAMVWMVSSGLLQTDIRKSFRAKIEQELKSRDRFEAELKKQMAATQFYWVGHINYEELVKNSR